MNPMANPTARQQLGQAVEDRISQLGLSYVTVAEKADFSVETLAKIRRGDVVRNKTLGRLDTAIQWPPGRAKSYVDPTTVPPQASDADDMIRAVSLDKPPVELQKPTGRLEGTRPLFSDEVLTWWPRPNGGLWYRMVSNPDDVDLRVEAAYSFPADTPVDEVVRDMRENLDALKHRD